MINMLVMTLMLNAQPDTMFEFTTPAEGRCVEQTEKNVAAAGRRCELNYTAGSSKQEQCYRQVEDLGERGIEACRRKYGKKVGKK